MKYNQKFKDWLYRCFLAKKYLEWKQKHYAQGYEHAKADADHWWKSKVSEMEKSWFVDPDNIFSIGRTGFIMLGGQQIGDKELANLKSEVRALKSMQIYEIMQHTTRQKALERSVIGATDLYSAKGNEQVLAGKMMVYSLDIIKTVIDRIDKAKSR